MSKKTFLIFLSVACTGLAFLWFNSPSRVLAKMPPEVERCLSEKLGSKAFEEIASGERTPTDIEKKNGQGCFVGLIKQDAKVKIKDDVKSCLIGALGKEPKDLDGPPTAEQDAKMQKCFQKKEKVGVGFPGETKQCIASIVGKARMEAIVKGGEPTAAEKMKIGPKCFGFRPPKEAEEKMKDLPPEARKCIEGIIGRAKAEPSEAQKREIGEKCFGDAERNQAKEGMKQLSDQDKKCFESVIGKPLDRAGKLTADQERAVGEKCFSKKTPDQMTKDESNRRTANFTQDQRECLRRLFGRPIEEMGELNPQQQQLVGNCMGPKDQQPADQDKQQQQNIPPQEETPVDKQPLQQQDVSKEGVGSEN